MSRSAVPGTAEPAAHAEALRPGTRVWLLRDGRFGRVVATAQGGLLCRVRLESGAAIDCPGCELLPLHGTEPA